MIDRQCDTGASAVLAGVLVAREDLLATQLGARTRASVLGPVDRALGFGFGALKGLILTSLAFLLLLLAADFIGGKFLHSATMPKPPERMKKKISFVCASHTPSLQSDTELKHREKLETRLKCLVCFGAVLRH